MLKRNFQLDIIMSMIIAGNFLYLVNIYKWKLLFYSREVKEMLRGIGTDTIEIDRVKKAAQKHATFITRIFTEREISICEGKPDYYASLAARFAAKEAVLKAFGTGLRGFKWKDIEVLNNPAGAPQIHLHREALNFARSMGVDKVWISLSHSRSNVVAFCVMEGGGAIDEFSDGTGNVNN